MHLIIIIQKVNKRKINLEIIFRLFTLIIMEKKTKLTIKGNFFFFFKKNKFIFIFFIFKKNQNLI